MFRGEEMVLVQLFLPPIAAYKTLCKLGEESLVQFRDLNADKTVFQRKFIQDVTRCNEMERKLDYIKEEIEKEGLYIKPPDDVEVPNPKELYKLETEIEQMEREIREFSRYAQDVTEQFQDLTLHLFAIDATHNFLSDTTDEFIIGEDSHLSYIVGAIPHARMFAFKQILWRVSVGNIFIQSTDRSSTAVFLIVVHGDRLRERVLQVCEGFNATLFMVPEKVDERQEAYAEVKQRLREIDEVIVEVEVMRRRVLKGVARRVAIDRARVKMAKAVYHTLNKFNSDMSREWIIGECWIPLADMRKVRKVIEEQSTDLSSFMNVLSNHEIIPPTFNRSNKFTRGFQHIIDSYGVANYREINPAFFSIVTFPFLFAVMFGDLGHGIILFIFGVFLVAYEKYFTTGKNSIADIFFDGRYLILMMGIFTIYTGFMYNDVFSKAINIFQSSWTVNYTYDELKSRKWLQLNPSHDYLGTPYPFGLDPIWDEAKNSIIFLNSYKMKLSIIFGIFHMSFGLCLSVFNYAYYRRYYSIFLEFIPQLTFLVLIFMWLVVLIFMKWILYGANYEDIRWTPGCAPSVLLYFINMMMFTKSEARGDCEPYMFKLQPYVQVGFVFVAVGCVPVIFLGKPLWLYFRSKRNFQLKKKRSVHFAPHKRRRLLFFPAKQRIDSELSVITTSRYYGDGDEMSVTESFIHQGIFTIEYVISSISHTASYLRLWALSLAHAQLSKVLWTMVMARGLNQSSYVGAIMLFFTFGFWAFLTMAILVIMEGLSAFLHTLRLHWVEFMSKFYHGSGGYLFEPFSFKTILNDDD